MDESAPIHGMLFIAPDTCGRPVAMQLAEHQFNLFFHFTGLADGAPNLLLRAAARARTSWAVAAGNLCAVSSRGHEAREFERDGAIDGRAG